MVTSAAAVRGTGSGCKEDRAPSVARCHPSAQHVGETGANSEACCVVRDPPHPRSLAKPRGENSQPRHVGRAHADAHESLKQRRAPKPTAETRKAYAGASSCDASGQIDLARIKSVSECHEHGYGNRVSEKICAADPARVGGIKMPERRASSVSVEANAAEPSMPMVCASTTPVTRRTDDTLRASDIAFHSAGYF